MGQIVTKNARPKRANLIAIQTGSWSDYVPSDGEFILIDETNSMNEDGEGKFNAYIIGDGVTKAKNLPLQYDMRVIEHYKYLFAFVDTLSRYLFGVDKDGNLETAGNIIMKDSKFFEKGTMQNTLFHIIDAERNSLLDILGDGHIVAGNGITLDHKKSGVFYRNSYDYLFALTDDAGNVLLAYDKRKGIYCPKMTGVFDAKVVDNYDYLLVFLDHNGNFLCGIKKDGSFAAPKIQMDGVKHIESPEFIYVLLDDKGKILQGIRKNGETFIPKGQPEETKEELKKIYKSIKALESAIGQGGDLKINNVAINKVMYNGNQGRAYLGNVALQAPGQTDYCIIMMYGQSLSNGSENPAGFNDPVVENCFMLGNSVWNTGGASLQPLSVGGTVREDGVATGTRQDTIVSTVNSFVTLYKKERPWDKNTKFIACSLGVGGRTVAQLSGAARYPYCNEHQLDARVRPFFEAVKAIADAEGKTISLSAVFWKQGENDYGTGHIGKTYEQWLEAATAQAQEAAYNMSMSGSYDAYYKGLNLLKEDIFALAKQIFGNDQQNRPVFMPYSVCGTYINNAYMTINAATQQLAEDFDDIIQVGPTYVTPDYNGGHLAMNGYRWYGEYCAKALYHVFLKGIDWTPLQPYNFEVQGNKIYIYINPIVPPLRFDKYTIDGAYKNLGFSVRMGTVAQLDANKTMTSGGLLQRITDVAIIENCIVLTCGDLEEFTGAVEVSYAGQGESGYSGHNQGAGNLRDSDTWSPLYAYRQDEADHGSKNTTNWVWGTPTAEELETLDYWDATFAAATGYSQGDKCLYPAIEYPNSVAVVASNADNNKTRPANPVNYHTQDVKGNVIVGKPYPMQNWCLNFYKRIILG